MTEALVFSFFVCLMLVVVFFVGVFFWGGGVFVLFFFICYFLFGLYGTIVLLKIEQPTQKQTGML